MPVLPAVPSTTRPPGSIAPRASASRMMYLAARSLTDPPGFRNSALPRMSQPVCSEALRSRISGVLPIASMKPSRTSTVPGPSRRGILARGRAREQRALRRLERQAARGVDRQRAHLAQRAPQHLQQLLGVQPARELGELGLEEDQAQGVLEGLHLRVVAQAALAHQLLHAQDAGLVVAL